MSEPVDLEALLAEVADTVAGLRAAGTYPPGLEAELDEHYRRVTGRPAGSPVDALSEAVEVFAARGRVGGPAGADAAQSRGGAFFERVVDRLVGPTIRRHQGALVAQLDEAHALLVAALRALVAALDPQAVVDADVEGRLDALDALVADVRRRLPDA